MKNQSPSQLNILVSNNIIIIIIILLLHIILKLIIFQGVHNDVIGVLSRKVIVDPFPDKEKPI